MARHTTIKISQKMKGIMTLIALLAITPFALGEYEGVYSVRKDNSSEEQLVLHQNGTFSVHSDLDGAKESDGWKKRKWKKDKNKITLKVRTFSKETHIFTFLIATEEGIPVLSYFATTSKKKNEDKFKLSSYWPFPNTWKKSANKTVDTTAANARLFHYETSKSTILDVAASTEAAVVSP